MTFFGDMYFFVILAAALVPAAVLGLMEKPLKYYGGFLTLFFLFVSQYNSPQALAQLIIYIAFEVCLLYLYLGHRGKVERGELPGKDRPRGQAPWLWLFASLMPLVYVKIVEAAGLSGGKGLFAAAADWKPLLVLGISYLTFRTVQMLLEIHDGVITEISLPETLYFLLFFPAILSGPIDRSRRFHEDLTGIPSREEYLELLGEGLWKISLGILYKFGIGAGFYVFIRWIVGRYIGGIAGEVVYMYAYGGYIFFDFAGYSLMAVGTSYILGVRIPDNFDKPFLAEDMKDFWNRWHITLSHWFRDYLFTRFMMAALKKKWFKSKLTAASLAFLINMGVMGLWHGFTWYYLAYGLYHGALLALTEIWQKKSRFHKAHKKDTWYRLLCWFVTFHLVMAGFYLFSGRLGDPAIGLPV